MRFRERESAIRDPRRTAIARFSNSERYPWRACDERDCFLAAVRAHPKPTVQTLARTLALTGCRVSEALSIRACDVDLEAAELRIATLKRHRAAWRAVPVPEDLGSQALELVHSPLASLLGRPLGAIGVSLIGERGCELKSELGRLRRGVDDDRLR